MVKTKIKPILPSLREKKRYLVFEVISKNKFTFNHVSHVLWNAMFNFLGQLGMSKAGVILLENKWSDELQKGILKVNHKNVDNVKASLMLATKINDEDVIVRSLGVSGILKKAENNYLKN